MPTYTESEIRDALMALLDAHDLTWDEFMELGAADELAEIDADLDFAYRALLPSLRSLSVA